jgi:uncharacterized protein (TIGR02453 family)
MTINNLEISRMAFKGFAEAGISFLSDLSLNNNKDWFEQRRDIYENLLLEPLKLLTTDLQLIIKAIDSNIDTRPALNKTISKIYRDTRFSKDKSPFRTGLWITFKRPVKVWGNVPEFYFYFTPKEYQYGMGFYSATPSNMEKIRDSIMTDTDRFAKIISHYNSRKDFVLVGEEYKKNIPNALPKEFQKWFQKKNLCMSCIRKMDDRFFSIQLKEDLEKAFDFNAELYHFLMESINP